MVDDVVSQMATIHVQKMMIVVVSMRFFGVAMLLLVVFYGGSSIAILARRQHVLGYVDALIKMRIILDFFVRLFGGEACRGVVHGDLFLHLCEGKAWAAEWIEEEEEEEEEERWAELLFLLI